jgi:hypothetical protein
MSVTAAPGRLDSRAFRDSYRDLLHTCAKFRAVEAEISGLLEAGDDPPSDPLARLHQEWCEACSEVIQLPAHTREELRAKAAMLIEVLAAVVGNTGAGAKVHIALAASLARDVLACPIQPNTFYPSE